MLALGLLASLAIAASVEGADAAADIVTLNDGTVLRGQVVAGAAFQGLSVLVRRDWARQNAREWLAGWEAREALVVARGRRERKERLIAWRKARGNGSGDPIIAWIDREIGRLSTLRPPPTVLTAALVTRPEIRSVVRAAEEPGRLLRLGWLAGLGDVETMPSLDLTTALQARGPLPAPEDDPARVDALLPIVPESDELWRTRRAAIEVAAEPALRFVQFRQFLLPETGPGAEAAPRTTTELIDSPAGRNAFAAIQAVTPFDAVDRELDAVADLGRIGAIVSRLTFNLDSDAAEAESTFWVQRAGGRWSPVFTRSASIPTDAPEPPEPPAGETTPILTTLRILELVASSPSSPETSRERQRVASHARRALGRARAALDFDLAPFLPSDRPRPR